MREDRPAANAADIKRTQREIGEYREKVETDNADLVPDEAQRQYQYNDPTLGNVFHSTVR